MRDESERRINIRRSLNSATLKLRRAKVTMTVASLFSSLCLNVKIPSVEHLPTHRADSAHLQENIMRRSMSAFVLALLVCSARNARGQEKPPTPDEAAIQQSAVDFVDAYNAQNADAIIALFNPKARVETAEGEVIEGVDKIKAGFEQVFKDEPDGLISLRMDSLIFITPDVAIEQGATEFFPDGEMLTTRSKYLVAHLKKDGKWKMISVRTLNEEVVSNYEFLRQLKFFVGEWIDEDPDSVVESKVYWDEGKNFLIHDFNVRRGKEWIQKGTQRIGWDPQA